jgi:parallel beta-helix repeat protein
MCKAPRIFLGAAILFVVLFAGNAMAVVQTVQVVPAGGTPCANNAQYPTIQQAVNSVTPNSTILVCPGIYPEQVLITKSITLKGINITAMNTAASGATIVPPASGMISNATSLASTTQYAAQVLVQGAAKVNISNLSVNGSNSGIDACAPSLVGILYQNASGTINQVSVLNETLADGLTGCQSGLGIYVQSGVLNSVAGTSTVKVTDSIVQDYQKNGITGNEQGTTLTVSASYLVGHGSTDGAAENGIQFGFGAAGSATTNTVNGDVWAPDTFSDTGDAAAGILIYGSQAITLTSNNISNTQYGIAAVDDLGDSLFADKAVIKSNKISGTHLFDGIEICNNSSTVELNTIFSSDEAAIHLDGSSMNGCTGAGNGTTVSGNVINTACAGILGIVGNNTVGVNTFYNVANTTDAADTCESVTPGVEARSHAKPAAKNQISRAVRPIR